VDDQALLLDRARAGDHVAFARLVRTFETDLRAVVRGMLRERDQIDDVLQEALLRAYRGLAGYRGESSLRTWLQRITRNACLDQLRRRRVVESLDDEGRPELPSVGPDAYERASTRHDVAAAVAALPTEQRVVVELVHLHDLDYGTVSQLLGIPRGTVASRLHRAHGTLRVALTPAEELAA